MSHVAAVDLEIKDLDALEAAAKTIGLRMDRNVHNYRRHSQLSGSIPEYLKAHGITRSNVRSCEHKLTIPGDLQAYEIGIVKSKTSDCYVLLLDDYCGGFGLMERVSANGSGVGFGRLKQAYGAQVAAKALKAKGMRVQVQNNNGKIQVIGRK